MKCSAAQRQILNTEREPFHPELAQHLAICSHCANFAARLRQVENAITTLPVTKPRLGAKAELLRKIILGESPRPPKLPTPIWLRPQWLAAAAAVTLLALGIARLVQKPTLSPKTNIEIAEQSMDGFLLEIVRRNVELAALGPNAEVAPQRLKALAGLAEDLRTETCDLVRVARAEELTSLVTLYRRVLDDGLLPQATTIPLDKRAETLNPIASELTAAIQRLETLTREVPAEMVATVRDLQSAAIRADQLIREKIREANQAAALASGGAS